MTGPDHLATGLLGGALLGVSSHLAIFIRGEWHMRTILLVTTYSVLAAGLCFAEYYHLQDFSAAIKATGLLLASYFTGLFTSIVIYRLYFHRLRHFPGPSGAAVSKFWHVWKCFERSNHLVVHDLYKRYGPIIRTGPEELTIVDPSILSLLDGPKSQFTKAPWYDIFLPDVSINATRDVAAHDARRRIWDRGFSPKAMSVYEERLEEYAHLLAAQIHKLADEGTLDNGKKSKNDAVINVTEWMSWFAFDLMGEFAFARSFRMLQDKKWHSRLKLLVDAMGMMDTVSPVPWLAQFALSLRPRLHLSKNWAAMMRWCKECMDERLQLPGEHPDVSQWLIDASRKTNPPFADRAWLDGDAVTIIVAGSGTVSVALVFAFYELALHTEQQAKLFEELREVDIYDRVQLRNCAHLNAVIHETLRLHPPIPTGGYRVTPPEGATINLASDGKSHYIPGGVTVVAPRYSIQRLETSYRDAADFVPERWTTRKEEMTLDPRGFGPFAMGRYGCIGRALAMSEMRLVIAILVKRFVIGFADEVDKGEEMMTGLKDTFTFAPGNLWLRFRLRSGGGE
ncbi:cytochrome P450 [Xylariaceae sp. FL0594]|nr:cytochrome P450 [Xylariaceae sp. FL0594]